MSLAWVLLVIIVVYLYREKVKRILFYSNALYVVENFKDTEELNAYIEGHILLTPALGRTISIKINSSKIFYLITAINIERFFFVLFGHTTFIGLLIPPRQQYGNPDYHPFMFDHDPTFLSFTKYFYFERFQSLFPMNLLVHQRMIHWRTPDRGAFLRLLNNLERIGTTSRKRERTRRLALIPEQTFGCFKASQNFKEWTSRHDLLKDPENMISSIPDPFVRRKGKSCPGEAFVFSVHLYEILTQSTWAKMIFWRARRNTCYFEILVSHDKNFLYLENLVTLSVIKQVWKGKLEDLSEQAEYTLAYWMHRLDAGAETLLQPPSSTQDNLSTMAQQRKIELAKVIMYLNWLHTGLHERKLSYIAFSALAA